LSAVHATTQSTINQHHSNTHSARLQGDYLLSYHRSIINSVLDWSRIWLRYAPLTRHEYTEQNVQ